MASDTDILIPVDRMTRLVANIMAAAGCAQDEAHAIAEHLVAANLAGHDSHGVLRTPIYLRWMKAGNVHPGRRMRIVSEAAAHARVDGDRGFGQTIGAQAVDLGIAKARQAGIAAITLSNCGHLGRIGHWAERAAEAGLISIHFVNVGNSILVAPFGGAQRRFGTNPFCIGLPGEGVNGAPLLLDFATSMVAEGKVQVAAAGGKKLPAGALVTPDGTLSSDPETLYGPVHPGQPRDAKEGKGAIRTFGEHKGSGLAFMCEMLAGCLTGNGTAGGPTAPPAPGLTNGMLSLYLNPGACGVSDFSTRARDYALHVKEAAGPDGEVLVPGEPERRVRTERMANGIPLSPDSWGSLTTAAQELGVPLD